MLIQIPKILTSEQAGEFNRTLDKADWSDGRETAGYLSSRVKANEQLSEKNPLALRFGDLILDRLRCNPQFMSAALPLKIIPPLFNRYRDGQAYGNHIDGAVRPVAGSSQRVRTDLSATLFLSDPADYDGGELEVEDGFGSRSIKLTAGDMVLYPGTSVHRVTPVTRGTRIAAFFWIQSLVRGNEQRALLYELDCVVQTLGGSGPSATRRRFGWRVSTTICCGSGVTHNTISKARNGLDTSGSIAHSGKSNNNGEWMIRRQRRKHLRMIAQR